MLLPALLTVRCSGEGPAILLRTLPTAHPAAEGAGTDVGGYAGGMEELNVCRIGS